MKGFKERKKTDKQNETNKQITLHADAVPHLHLDTRGIV